MIALRPDAETRARYRATGQWGDATIAARIDASVAAHPEKTAVVDAAGHALTYRALDDAAARIAGFLARRGVGRGDVVTMHLPNWTEAVVATCAALRLGAVVNPVPPTYGWGDLAYILKRARSRALVIPARFRSADYVDRVRRAQEDTARLAAVLVVGEDAGGIGTPWQEALAAGPVPLAAADADEPAALLFTSGTESRPKGAVHTHNTILFGERSFAEALRLGADDICFMASPVTHTTGFMHGIVMTLMLGGTLSLLDIFTGDRAVEVMDAAGATWTMGATPFLADTVASLETRDRRLPQLRYFLCGGAPIPEVIVRRAAALDIRVLAVYGSTESPPHTVVFPDDPLESAWTSDGRPLPGIEVAVVDEEGREVPVGGIGEELSRGPNTFIGYLDEPELTARAIDAEGWYRSGDLARRNADGSIRIVGRLKDMIIRGGQNISAREVEDLIMEHPACQAVALVGIPDARLGERGCAVLVPRPGATLDLPELVRFLEEKGIAKFKLPERLVLVDSLPVTPSGKIQKFRIKQMLADKTPEGT